MKKFFHKKYVILIFSRPNSSRLLEKYRKKVHSYDLIEIPIIRLKNYFSNKMIKLCVPTEHVDKYKVYSKRHNIEIFHGPEEDVMKRIKYNINDYDYFIRVTGDDPLTSPELIYKFIKKARVKKYDYIYTNDIADGLIPELISKRYLNFIYSKVLDKKSTSYLTYYFIRDFENFKKYCYKLPYDDTSSISLTIDYKKDLIKIRNLLQQVYFNINISLTDLMNLIRKNKNNLNSHRKKKYFNLVTNDYDVRISNEKKLRYYF